MSLGWFSYTRETQWTVIYTDLSKAKVLICFMVGCNFIGFRQPTKKQSITLMFSKSLNDSSSQRIQLLEGECSLLFSIRLSDFSCSNSKLFFFCGEIPKEQYIRVRTCQVIKLKLQKHLYGFLEMNWDILIKEKS